MRGSCAAAAAWGALCAATASAEKIERQGMACPVAGAGLPKWSAKWCACRSNSCQHDDRSPCWCHCCCRGTGKCGYAGAHDRSDAAGEAPRGCFSPFRRNDTAAYVFRKDVARVWAERDATVRRACTPAAARALAAAAGGGGVSWNSVGVSFAARWDYASAAMRDAVEPMYLYDAGNYAEKPSGPGYSNSASVQRKVQRVLLSADHAARPTPAKARSSPAPLLARVARDGFALVESWGIRRDALRRIAAQAHAAVRDAARSKPGSAVVSTAVRIAEVEAWLHSRDLLAAVAGYMGPDAELSGYTVLHLTDGLVSTGQYYSGFWHHDRCGRRLKAFLFLHDVDPDRGRPTRIAVGSHNTLYYSYHNLQQSRFKDSYIETNYTTKGLGGPRGGGFLFDTNAVHKATVRGAFNRTVILVEFNSAKKVAAFGSRSPRMHVAPCPSFGYHYTSQGVSRRLNDSARLNSHPVVLRRG